MKPGQLLRKIIYSSWFLAGIPALVLMLFFHPVLRKYNIKVENAGVSPGQSMYADLNGDTVTEFILESQGVPYYHLLICDNQHRIYDQWNLYDNFEYTMAPFFTGNFDHDRFSELYVFTHKDDSLFLNVNEFFDRQGLKRERIFISYVGFIKGVVTSTVLAAGFHDRNGDGLDELYFSITTGFGVEPRRLFSYDLASGELRQTPELGIITQFPVMSDADGDGKPEIFGTLSASGNQKEKYPFSDYSTWLMVFGEDLEFKFNPVQFTGYPALLETREYHDGTERFFLVSRFTSSADSTVEAPAVLLFTTSGQRVKSKACSDIGTGSFFYLYVSPQETRDRIFILSDKITELDGDLEPLKVTEIPLDKYYSIFRKDINNDGNEELLLYCAENQEMLLYDKDMSLMGELALSTPDEHWAISRMVPEKGNPRLYIWSGGSSRFMDVKRNRFVFLGFMAYPGIFIAFFLLIFGVKKITTSQIVQKEALKQRLVALQLQGIKAQLDPHFTFNTLNTVASLIYQNEREEAYDYMNRFTKLLRGMISDAEKIYRTLGEELEFVKTYLELEQHRMGGKFSFSVELGEGVTQQENVPKLVLQTFVENSVKHGISPYESGGRILIKIRRERNNLKLTVEDNGIGRAQSAGKSSSTGRGLKLATEFYEILNQINRLPIRHRITDLHFPGGQASGTRVDIWVPVENQRLR